MRRTNALRRLLEDMTAVFNDRERLTVEFGDTPHAKQDGETVVVAPNVSQTYGKRVEGAQELRIIIDTLSHEVEHVRESVLTSKESFSKEFPQYPQLAGHIINIVEDQYIDWKRGRRFKGTRRTQAYKTHVIMSNDSRHPPIDRLERKEAQLFEGFFQIAFMGKAKGFNRVDDDDVREYLAWARDQVNRARRTEDVDAREQISRELTEQMIARFPPKPDRDALEDRMNDANTDETPDVEPDPTQPMPPQQDDDEDGPADADGDDEDGGNDDTTIDVDKILDAYDAGDLAVVD